MYTPIISGCYIRFIYEAQLIKLQLFLLLYILPCKVLSVGRVR